MSKPLSIDRAVDGNLKPVKDSDGTLTALEVSADTVRVKDLEIAGNISSPLKVDGNLTIDSGGDIALDAGGGDITFAAGGTSYLNWLATGTLQMLAALDVDDYLSFDITSNGVSYISTNDDSGGNLANLILNVSGDIILNSKNGVFIQQNNGTEFSATNSAYAGMILGYTRLRGDDTDYESYEIQDDLTVESADHQITFITPPSENVEIECSVMINTASTDTKIFVGVSDSSTYNSIGEQFEYDVDGIFFSDDETDDHNKTFKFVLGANELEAIGVSNTFYIGFSTGGATKSAWVQYGLRASHNLAFPPFIIKATALPVTIFDAQ